MPNRTIAFAHTAFPLLAALIAALLLATWELTIPTAQHSAVVWIVGDEGTSDSARVAETVERVAAEQGVAIGFTAPDVRTPESLSHLYLAVGDPDSRYADWLTEGYPSFNPATELRVHPVEALAERSPRGYYLVFGPPENARVLTEALAEHGLRPDEGGSQARLWQSFLGGPLFNVLALALLAGVTAVGAGVLLGSRDYAVQRLLGSSYGRILLRDLGRVARLWGAALPGAALVALACLGLYNDWNQLGFFALVALVFAGVFAAVAVAVHAAVLGLVHTTAILPALKGRIPVRAAQVGAYLVRVPVLLLVLAVLGSVVHLAQTTREQRASLEAFARTGRTSHVALNGSVGMEDSEAADSLLGPWLRRADREGRVVIADQHAPESVVPVGSGRPGFDVLVVNDTYLEKQEIVSPSGERYGPAASEERVRVLLPPAHASHRGEIERAMPDWLRLQNGGGESGTDVEILPAADGQTVFTYGSRAPFAQQEPPFLRDPVVIALPNGSVLSDSAYVTYMTHEAVLFPDPGVVERAREADPRMAEYVNAVQPILNKAAGAHAADLNLLRIEAFNLVAGTALLLLTGIASCVIHARTRAQTVFARHISGWGFLATHRRFLAVEAGISLGFAGWAAWNSLTTLRALSDPARMLPPELVPTTGLEPLYAAAIAATGLALTLGALAFFHRRIVREGSSQA
ncbi:MULTISPECIES: hypothetical protein [Nocardiopsis]|uniref:ABC3 transporter permease protein domain-containing protein n=1 Tax=Nocardiopsis dassonvillei (strain ATCC 23218 / DSM 43111 / CIP 107115 / JCM 7437 / KCTC 9190 / NBRC 14626 / NCTC 10488 / NRRL B-5397 / IMRU 509) TaxID=446468 RepID=D7AYN2_NOCDD|nr:MULTISPECIES: hypothetical protein [Nocardiopsis]ADH68044.1 conserved hypothetical protein [Nocardiopsis dassonvillei subsp. dassonvillei DSM 43111]NKY81460.1 hypothetical protein [Nocardiopsis dassonvillei]VEI88543.1 Uncharacterized protein conserved in bacteria [Nocardiopsis dassonvillei]